jgi:hypothetical protein
MKDIFVISYNNNLGPYGRLLIASYFLNLEGRVPHFLTNEQLHVPDEAVRCAQFLVLSPPARHPLTDEAAN